MVKRKVIYKIISYSIILAIFCFLSKTLFENWQKVKNYDFSFNYFYLILSFILVILSIIVLFFIWNRILRIIEPNKKISYFKAVQIVAYSWFGRYLPGKVWMFLGRIYLGEKSGLNKKVLTISVIYEIILSVASAFLFALIFLGISFGAKAPNFYILSLVAVFIGFLFVHPKVFNFIFNFILSKFKKTEVPLNSFLTYWNIVEIVFYYFIAYALNGTAFFFLIKSLVYLPFCDIMGVIGLFNLASVLGTIALFAPSGIGVREGVLVIFLQFYFPIGIAVSISLISRIWATLSEVIIFVCVYLYSKLTKI